jgi:hypothetical protein
MNFTPENGSTLQVVVVGENRIGTERTISERIASFRTHAHQPGHLAPVAS